MTLRNECEIHSWSILTDTTENGRYLLLAQYSYGLKEAMHDVLIRRQQIRCQRCGCEEYRGYILPIPYKNESGYRCYYFLNEDNTPGKLFDYCEIAALMRQGIDAGRTMRILPRIPSPHLPVLRVTIPTGSEERYATDLGDLNGSPEDVLRWVWAQGEGASGAAQYGDQGYVLVRFYPANEAYDLLADYPSEQVKDKPEVISYVPPLATIGIKVAVLTDNLPKFVQSLASETNFGILDSTTVVVDI